MNPNTSMPAALPIHGLGAGLRTQFGTLLPPGGKVVAYVHASGGSITDDNDIRANVFTTLNAALAYARSSKGDAVMVLPGHTENISVANQMSNLVAGTRILGCGYGSMRPTFTWTAATSTFLMNVANVCIDNCILNMDPGTGTVNVAAPITVSAVGCTLTNCYVRMGTDANAKVTIGITTTAAGDDFTIKNCEIFGATAAGCTTMIQLVGADRFKFIDSTLVGATTAVGVGVMRFLTTASTQVLINNVYMANNVASSTAALTGMTGLTGFIDNTTLQVLSGGAAAFGTAGSITIGANVFATNAVASRAAVFGTAATLS